MVEPSLPPKSLPVTEEMVRKAMHRYNNDMHFRNIVNTAVATSYLGPSLVYLNEHTLAISRTCASMALILAEEQVEAEKK